MASLSTALAERKAFVAYNAGPSGSIRRLWNIIEEEIINMIPEDKRIILIR